MLLKNISYITEANGRKTTDWLIFGSNSLNKFVNLVNKKKIVTLVNKKKIMNLVNESVIT